MKLVIISGLSGAGKTVALKQYEDLGYYCIDNLPLGLLGPLALRSQRNRDDARIAVGVDARANPREIARFPRIVARQRARGVECTVMFLTAQDDVIQRRYSETRRKHPLTDAKLSLAEAIQREREVLEPIVDIADVIIDTTNLNLHALREEIKLRQAEGPQKFSLVLMSFGFKHGLPDAADFVFDVRWMANPYWVPELKPLDGRNKKVAEFIEQDSAVPKMIHDIGVFLRAWLPKFEGQDRNYVTVAIGCTGGRHRSVYVVEQLAASFRGQYDPVVVKHKELS